MFYDIDIALFFNIPNFTHYVFFRTIRFYAKIFSKIGNELRNRK